MYCARVLQMQMFFLGKAASRLVFSLGFLCLGFIKSADRSAFKKTKKKTTEKKKLKLKLRRRRVVVLVRVCVCYYLFLSLSFLYYYKKGNREVASRQRTAPAFEAFAAARNACSLSL